MRRNFTDKFVRTLKPAPPGKRVEYWDTKVQCFGVRVTDKGHKTYFLYLRWPGSRWAARREIGNADRLAGNPKKRGDKGPTVVGVEAARKVAREWLAKVELGIDPHAERKAADNAKKLAEQQALNSAFDVVAERWFATIRGQRRGNEVEADVRREFVKRFKGRQIKEITKAEMRDIIEAKAKKHPAQARNLLGYAKRFYTWAVDRDIVETSPVQLLRASKLIGERRTRDRILTDDELRIVWRVAEKTPYPYGPLIRMLILTGQRRSEVADAVWSEFDLDKLDPNLRKAAAEWIIPASRMKMKKRHLVPITDEMAEELADLPRFRSGPHLFSANNGVRSVNGFAKAKDRIDELTGPLAHWTFHDLRRTVRTNLSRIPTIDTETRERMIAHAQSKISQTYDLYDHSPQKRRGFELWGALLHTILNPPDSNVVALRR